MKLEPSAAAAVIGLSAFQLLQAWNANAPTLADLRESDPDDISVKQKLVDADFMIGGLSVIVGVAYAVLTKDMTVLLLLLVGFGTLSMWNHAVFAAESR